MSLRLISPFQIPASQARPARVRAAVAPRPQRRHGSVQRRRHRGQLGQQHPRAASGGGAAQDVPRRGKGGARAEDGGVRQGGTGDSRGEPAAAEAAAARDGAPGGAVQAPQRVRVQVRRRHHSHAKNFCVFYFRGELRVH